MMESYQFQSPQPKTCKSCDQCRNRKVRCIINPGEHSACTNCIKRNDTCQFTQIKRRLKVNKRLHQPENAMLSQIHAERQQKHSPDSDRVFLDYMLDHNGEDGILRDDFACLRAADHYVASSNLAFFSDSKLRHLSQKLGNNRLKELVERIEDVVRSRVVIRDSSSLSAVKFKRTSTQRTVPQDIARSYIESYFSNLHSIFPFLDRREFEEKAYTANVSEIITSETAFAALYHAILALGCQFHERRNFDPGQGEAWCLFQVALGYIPDILVPRESLMSLQALVAMSIFANTTCCLQVDELLLMEATRMALALRYHRAVGDEEHHYNAACRRTFWVIYYMEKHMTFHARRASMIPDDDIGCPIPDTPEAVVGGFNWFFSSIRFSRILSQAYTTLFSISAMIRGVESSRSSLLKIEDRLENWRRTVPEDFRPGCPVDIHRLANPSTKTAIIQTHFAYYGLVIALARLKLHVCSREPAAQCEDGKWNLLNAARTVIEMTQYVDVASYTPLFILAHLPLAALFILFDFVIHNPTHPETRINLSLLNVAAGHFGLLDYTSGGSLPASIVAEFAHIARQHVKNSSQNNQHSETTFNTGHLSAASPVRTFSDEVHVMPESQSLNGSNDHVGVQADIMVPWEPGESEYLHYPLITEPGQGFDGIPMAEIDFRTLFGCVISDPGVN